LPRKGNWEDIPRESIQQVIATVIEDGGWTLDGDSKNRVAPDHLPARVGSLVLFPSGFAVGLAANVSHHLLLLPLLSSTALMLEDRSQQHHKHSAK
jgi:hypothetical protein